MPPGSASEQRETGQKMNERMVTRQGRIERRSEALQRQPDDVKVVIEVNAT